MATGASIHKVELQIADIDRHYYRDHALTVACHPSETAERLMVRLLAFALYAHEALAFGRGLSTPDEPDLWRKDLTGSIDLWIDVGQPDERNIRRACNRARQVVVICYGGRGADLWWSQNGEQLKRQSNLTVLNLPFADTKALAAFVDRNMRLQCNVQDGQVSILSGAELVRTEPVSWLRPVV